MGGSHHHPPVRPGGDVAVAAPAVERVAQAERGALQRHDLSVIGSDGSREFGIQHAGPGAGGVDHPTGAQPLLAGPHSRHPGSVSGQGRHRPARAHADALEPGRPGDGGRVVAGIQEPAFRVQDHRLQILRERRLAAACLRPGQDLQGHAGRGLPFGVGGGLGGFRRTLRQRHAPPAAVAHPAPGFLEQRRVELVVEMPGEERGLAEPGIPSGMAGGAYDAG